MTEVPAPNQTIRAGVIGLGMIGGGVAVSLANRGQPPVAVYDIRPDAAAGLTGVPAPLASPAAVAAACDVVLIAVVDAAQAFEVLDGADGVLSVARPGLVVVLLSTVSLAAVRELSARCEQHGAVLLDAGVTGGMKARTNGLVVMVGGPDDAVRRATPVLDGFAKAVVHCGGPGTGMATKLARNAVTYAQWAVMREAASIAHAGDVPLDRLLAVLQAGDDDSTAPTLFLKLMAAGYQVPEAQVEFANNLAQKDLAAAQEFAAEVGIELPIVDVVRPRMLAVYRGSVVGEAPADP